MTKLQAVNEVLAKAGHLPVPALDENINGASLAARVERVLDQEELRIQIEGWHYNRRVSTLTRNSNNQIECPTGTLAIDTTREDEIYNVTQLGSLLYDLDNNTYVFERDLKCEYILRIEYACIPPPVREYIACSAAARYNEQFGSQSRQPYLFREQERARTRALQFDERVGDVNILKTDEARRLKGWRYSGGIIDAPLPVTGT